MINTTETVNMVAAPNVQGLAPDDQEKLRDLFDLWREKLARNQLRKKYYRQKNALKDLGISIPPQLKSLETSMGWAAKAVDMLAVRSRFDGFVYQGQAEGIEDILRQNNFNIKYRQATTSELIHSCAFLTVSKGGLRDPEVVISAYSAENGAAHYNSRLNRIDYGMTIIEVDDKTRVPTWINYYNDDAVVECRREGAAWTATYLRHSQGRPLMEPMVHSPELDRPMGKSRISRAVMSLVDSAVRCSLRGEVSSEFFTAPQKYLLGVKEDFFEDGSKWEAYIGNIIAITRDENGDIPQFGQLSQMSMQPHTEYMRDLAARFAGETGIPISSLGVIHDNPASAEAMRTAQEDLITAAQDLNDTNGVALRNIGLLVHAIRNNTTIDALSEEERSIEVNWRNPAMPSIVSQSDAMIKQISSLPWLAETEVALEELGYTNSQRLRLKEEKRKIEARAALEQARQQAAERMANDEEGTKRTMYMMQSIISNYRRGAINRSNAILLFSQIGIDEDEANKIMADSEDMEDAAGEIAKIGGEANGQSV